jgi:hypothetical protein
MVAHYDWGTRKEYLQRDEGLDAKPDEVDEMDDVRGEEAQGVEDGGEMKLYK